MVRADHLAACEVGDGAGHPQQAVIAAAGKPHALIGGGQQPVGFGGEDAELFKQGGGQAGIAGDARPGIAALLHQPGGLHPLADFRRAFRWSGVRHAVVFHRGDLHLQIHAVQQRAAYFIKVQAHLGEGAGAGAGGMPVVAAGAGIHRADEHEAAGVGGAAARAADGDDPVLQRLTQRFHCGAGELRQFIHKQDAVMGQRYFPGAGDAAAAGQTRHGDGMVRRTEHPVFQQRDAAGQKACGGMDFGGFHRLLEAHGRQDGGQALGQHAFSRAGRADEQHIMSACGGDLQGALGVFLSLYLAEIRHGGLRHFPVGDGLCGGQRLSAGQRLHQLPCGAYRVYLDALHHAALGGVIVGDVDAGIALPGGLRDHRKDAVDGAQPSIQRNFPHKGAAGQRQIQTAARRKDAQQDGQIVQGAAFLGIGRGQIYHQHPGGKGISQIADGTVDPFPALLYGGIGQADDIKPGQSPAVIHLHGDGVAFNAV